MPSFEEWSAQDLSDDDLAVVAALYAKEPEWLATASVVRGELCHLLSEIPEGEDLIVYAEEITFDWGEWHPFMHWAYKDADKTATEVITAIESILEGRLVRMDTYDVGGKWTGSMLAKPEMASMRIAVEQFGSQVVRTAITSWTTGKR